MAQEDSKTSNIERLQTSAANRVFDKQIHSSKAVQK